MDKCKKENCNGTYVKQPGTTVTKWQTYKTYICNKCGDRKTKNVKDGGNGGNRT